jgi:hypothetical protein
MEGVGSDFVAINQPSLGDEEILEPALDRQ